MKITRERLEQILREELAAITEDPRDQEEYGDDMNQPGRGGVYKEAAHKAAKPAAEKDKLGFGHGLATGTLGTLAGLNMDKIQAFAQKLGGAVDKITDPEVLNQIMQVVQQLTVTEGELDESQWQLPKDRFSPGYKPTPEEKAEFAKHRERGKKKWERPEEPDDAFKGLSTRDITVGESITEGMGQALANTIREMLESAVEELGKIHEAGSAEYKAAMETLRKEVKHALGKDNN